MTSIWKPEHPWDLDSKFEYVAIPPLFQAWTDPNWHERGAEFVVLGHHRSSPAIERTICSDFSPLWSQGAPRLRLNIEPLGYYPTHVAYRLTEPQTEFIDDNARFAAIATTAMRLRQTFGGEMPRYPRPLERWGKNVDFYVSDVSLISYWIPQLNAGRFIILSRDSADEEVILHSDVCEHLLEQIENLLRNPRIRPHYPQRVAFQFIFEYSQLSILLERPDFQSTFPGLAKFGP